MTNTITDKRTGVVWHDLDDGFLIREGRLPDGAAHVVAVGRLHEAKPCAGVPAARALVAEWRG